MRPPHNNNNRRQRGNRPHNNNGGGNNHNNNRRPNGGGQPQNLRNQIFDSHGPGGERVRGNAFQVHEKYLSLARDAEERIDQENYYQHAEHYYRIVEAIQDMEAEQRARFTVVEQPDPFAPMPGSDDQPEIAGSGDQPQMAEAHSNNRPPRFRPQQQPRQREAGSALTDADNSSSPSFSLSDSPPADAAAEEKPAPRRRGRPAASTATPDAATDVQE